MDYEKKYKEAQKWIESIYSELSHEQQMEAEAFFPELKESEDEQSKKWILEYLYDGIRKSDEQFKGQFKAAIAWLEKQGELINSLSKGLNNAHERIDELIQKNNELCIKLEKQDKPVEINPTEFDTRLQALIGKFNSLPKEELIGSLSFWLNVVKNDGTYKPDEKQGEFAENNKDDVDTDFTIYHPLKNGEGHYECIPYSFYGVLSSFSEDKDMIDFLRLCFYTEEECNEWIKQNESIDSCDSLIIKNKEFPASEKRDFGYFSEPTDKIEPKFKVGDTMRTLQEAADGYTDGMPVVVSIDNEYYHCTNELIAIKDQDDYEFPPMNVKQKPNDMVEPKFQNRQWIVWQNKCYKVNYNGCGYELIDQNGLSTSLEYGTVDASARLYDITKDAKDGDVLASELCDSIILFRGIKDNNVDFYCDYDFSKIDIPGDRFSINDGQHYGDVEDSKDFHPATKEQRDTLIKAMTDAGWEFDFEKKELKKISQRMVSAEAKEALYDKPAWSEEDEYRINRISDFIWKNRKGDTDEIYQQEQDVNWLKSLKERIGWKPSDEQMDALDSTLQYSQVSHNSYEHLNSLYNDLKKLTE